MLGSFFNKVAGLKVCNKYRLQHGVSCGYCKIFKNSFLIQHLRWLLLTVLPRYNSISWGACSLISRLHVLSIYDEKLSRNVAQIILYHHVTKQFFRCLNWLVPYFRFQNMFWKYINCFRFDALCGWSGDFNFRVWFGKRKNDVWAKKLHENLDFDFVPLLFTLLT